MTSETAIGDTPVKDAISRIVIRDCQSCLIDIWHNDAAVTGRVPIITDIPKDRVIKRMRSFLASFARACLKTKTCIKRTDVAEFIKKRKWEKECHGDMK